MSTSATCMSTAEASSGCAIFSCLSSTMSRDSDRGGRGGRGGDSDDTRRLYRRLEAGGWRLGFVRGRERKRLERLRPRLGTSLQRPLFERPPPADVDLASCDDGARRAAENRLAGAPG